MKRYDDVRYNSVSSAACSEEAAFCCASVMTHTDLILMDTMIPVSIFSILGCFMLHDLLPLLSIIIISLLARIILPHPVLKEHAESS